MKRIAARSSRREFLLEAVPVSAAAIAFPTIIPGRALGLSGAVAPSNRITVGVIGTGNQGFNDIHSFLRDDRVQIVAVCDVNRESPGYWEGKVGGREPARRLVEEHYAKHRQGRDLPRLQAHRAISAKSWAATTSTPSRSARRTTGTRSWSIEACKAEEGHLLPEAAVAHDRRGPRDELRGQQVARRLPDRQPAAVRRELPPRLRAGPQRPDRRADERSASACPAAEPTTPRRATTRSRSRCPRASTTTSGSARPPRPPMPRPAATSTSAGSTTTPAARSPTGAATTPTAPVGHGHRDDRPGRDPQRQGRSSRPTRSGTPPPSIASRRSTRTA